MASDHEGQQRSHGNRSSMVPGVTAPSADPCVYVCFRAAVMAKRIADKELTDRNWDQEEEGEEVRLHYYQQPVEGDLCCRSARAQVTRVRTPSGQVRF